MAETTDKEAAHRIRYFHAKYISYSRAISVMWAVLCICHLIISIVCFVQSSWLETSDDAPTAAYFGLWTYAIADPIQGVMNEYGSFLDFGSSLFSTVCLLIAIAIGLGCLSVLTLGLSFCLSSNIVFMACGWLMSGNAVVMGLACAMFPTGWSHGAIVDVCQSSSYDSALCGVGKSYVLAGITACDSVVMAILAFILAYRQVTLLPWTEDDEDPPTEPKTQK